MPISAIRLSLFGVSQVVTPKDHDEPSLQYGWYWSQIYKKGGTLKNYSIKITVDMRFGPGKCHHAEWNFPGKDKNIAASEIH